MSDWRYVQLGDISKVQTGPFGSQLHQKDYVDNGIPLVTVKNLGQKKINRHNLDGVSEKDAKRLTRYTLRTGDVVFSRVGAYIDKSSIVTEEEDGWIFSSSTLMARPDSSKVDSEYLIYFLNSPPFKRHIRNVAVGATRPSLNTRILSESEISLPPLPEQKAIAHILGKLDDKIELNRQMNQTLEAMAQALFKSWFVDFDPVMDNALARGTEIPEALKAKAEKRQLVVDKKKLIQTNPELAKMFPSSFVFNETLEKWIPEGWEVKSLDEIAHYQNGLALQKFRPENEDDDFLPVLKISHLKDGKTDGKEKAKIDIKSSSRVEDGDVIFSWSASLIVDIWCGGKAALNQHLFKVTSDKFPKWFYYLFTKHHLDEFIRIAAGKAVTMGHIKREHLSDAKCAFMEKDVLAKITPHFENLIKKQITNRLETETLTQLRDTLLPQLISGKVRVLDKALSTAGSSLQPLSKI